MHSVLIYFIYAHYKRPSQLYCRLVCRHRYRPPALLLSSCVWTQKCLVRKSRSRSLTYLDTDASERDKDTRKAAESRTSAAQPRAKHHSTLFITFAREQLLKGL